MYKHGTEVRSQMYNSVCERRFYESCDHSTVRPAKLQRQEHVLLMCSHHVRVTTVANLCMQDFSDPSYSSSSSLPLRG